MTTYYVAKVARYVLVDAEHEAAARELGHAALYERYQIRTIRPATTDEIDLWNWHQQMLTKENER